MTKLIKCVDCTDKVFIPKRAVVHHFHDTGSSFHTRTKISTRKSNPGLLPLGMTHCGLICIMSEYRATRKNQGGIIAVIREF